MASICLLEVFCRSFRYPQLTQQWITIFPMLLEGAGSDIDRVKSLLTSNNVVPQMLDLFTRLCRETNSELNIAVQLINCFRSLVKKAKDICELCEHNLIAVLCNCAPLRRDVLPETESGEANPWHEIWCRLLEFICHLLGTARIEKHQRAVNQVPWNSLAYIIIVYAPYFNKLPSMLENACQRGE